jgi:predicted PurR-regulated permease PerM
MQALPSAPDSERPPIDLSRIVLITMAVLGTVAAAVLAYLLLDLLLLLFLGIIVAAAVQPLHVRLCRAGIPEGPALVLVFLPFLMAIGTICFIVGPSLVEELSGFVAGIPDIYANFRVELRDNSSALLRLVGRRMPSFDQLMRSAPSLSPDVFQGALQFTSGVLVVFAYFVTVLAVAFYWTLELPRIERLFLSLLPVARRARALTIWHEIESKLGAFVRGQAMLMLIIGIASAIGYALIGLPNVAVLGLLAGLLEAVPVAGPILAAVPAVIVAMPLGSTTVALTIGLAILLQGIENNILVPRIMSKATGTSALIGLLAVLGFGILYGILGVVIAIPVTAVAQVVLDRVLMDAEPIEETVATAQAPEDVLRGRVRALQNQVRKRLRQRDSRMGIDPESPDHLVDAFDQRLETAIERIDRILAARDAGSTTASAERSEIIAALHSATEQLEEALKQFDAQTSVAEGPTDYAAATDNAADVLAKTEHAAGVVDDIESTIAATQGTPREPLRQC